MLHRILWLVNSSATCANYYIQEGSSFLIQMEPRILIICWNINYTALQCFEHSACYMYLVYSLGLHSPHWAMDTPVINSCSVVSFVLLGAIGNMRRLQILNLTNNHISCLPSSVGKLKQLEELSLQ